MSLMSSCESHTVMEVWWASTGVAEGWAPKGVKWASTRGAGAS